MVDTVVNNYFTESSRTEAVTTEIVRNNTFEPADDGELFSGHEDVEGGVIGDNVLLGGTLRAVRERNTLVVEGNHVLSPQG